MNKEIKYLLNEMKDKECYYVGTNGCLYQDLTKEEIDLLLSYKEQLEKENDRLIAESTHYESKYYNEAKKVDKAIEYLKEKADYPISYYHCIREAIDILKGDSDE